MDSLIQKNIRIIIALALVVVAFWGGYEFGASSALKTAGIPSIAHPPTDSTPQGPKIVPVIGSVVSVSGSTITIKDLFGKQQTVAVDSSTVITTTKVVTESLSDIHVGDNLSAFGTEGSAGTLVAQTIQTNAARLPASGITSTSSATQ